MVSGHIYEVYTTGFEKRKADTSAIIFEYEICVGLDHWDTILADLSMIAPVFAHNGTGVGK